MLTDHNSCSRQILVVEDEEEIRTVLQEVLELEGYRVVTAQNGLEAIHCLQTNCAKANGEPCVILLDLMMPVMSGFEFLKEKDKEGAFSQIPVVVVSAIADSARRERVQGILKKPVQLDTLLKTVETYCRAS